MPEFLKYPSVFSGLSARVSAKCQNVISVCTNKEFCRRCCVNLIIFVPKLLNKNRSQMIIIIYLNSRKQYLRAEAGRAYSRVHLVYIFRNTNKNQCFIEK